MRKVLIIAVVFGGLALVGCADSSDSSSESNGKPFAYDVRDEAISPPCASQQSFSTLKAECLGLQDEALNKACAQTQREQVFESQCPGQVFIPNGKSAPTSSSPAPASGTSGSSASSGAMTPQ